MMERLSWPKRIAYGMAGLSNVLPDLILMQWLMVRYVPPNAAPLIPEVWLGFLMLCGRTTEGITCPIVGHWSDNCRHRWGRRLPFMRFGIAPFLLLFLLLYNPPAGAQQVFLVVWVFVLLQGYSIVYNTICTPYLALLPEIAPASQDRVNLMTFQSAFTLVGACVFAGLGALLARWGWAATTVMVAGLIALFYVPVATMIRERPGTTGEPESLRLWASIRQTFSNRPFLFVLASTSCFFFALNGLLLLIPYWVMNGLGGSESDVTFIMAPYLVVCFLFFAVFNRLAQRLGKHILLIITYAGAGFGLVALALAGHFPFGTLYQQSAVIIALMGAPIAGFMVLPYPILSDVIDYDAARTGRRREAVFFGVQGIAQKAMVGLSVLTFTVLRYLTEGAGWIVGLRVMMLCCACACFAGLAIFLFYPLREKTAAG